MDHFLYRDGILHAEDVPMPRDRGRGRHALLRLFLRDADAALPSVRGGAGGPRPPRLLRGEVEFQQAVLAHLAGLGAGMDVVSGGEYLRAKAAGVPGERIVFSGVGKTAEEMRMALRAASASSTSKASRSSSAVGGRDVARRRRRPSRCA
jgi:diaminopimelate decarboxylase